MLQTLKKNKKLSNLFYGINSGNYGFLMNKFSKKKIITNLTKAKVVSISPLEMVVNSKNKINDIIYKAYKLNDKEIKFVENFYIEKTT